MGRENAKLMFFAGPWPTFSTARLSARVPWSNSSCTATTGRPAARNSWRTSRTDSRAARSWNQITTMNAA
ncbi:hypothetical protein Acsp06_37120 [Actinomycetospora sp. NBRC 106375]|uniref:hypothetical protein n=1 Tax=Actinomycetospora sp. NBRC 106375 TaxID=3032207 RepID=UPI0024A4B283|nr:hypothetical protein [Actinomycetospora sp. NBRC 106375]GLZ47527.1 hypothetical protein Acsp06_37120 [Actinomycetospora sp. NBRC 106375]